MKIQYNALLSKILKEHSITEDLEKTKIPKNLMDFLNEGIAVVDDCYYFKRHASGFSETFQDKTGNECFNNKTYIEYTCAHKYEPIEELKIGILFCKLLAQRLEIYNEHFVILLYFHDNSTEFRFHKKRKEEIPYLEDINGDPDCGVMEIDVNPK